MSTRSQIGFYDEVVVDGDATIKPQVMLYVHSDGYPEGPHGIPARLEQILPTYFKYRPYWDTEYMAAQVLTHMVMGLRTSHRVQAKRSISYHRKEIRKLKRKWGKSSPAMFAPCNAQAIRDGNFSGNKLGSDLAYHLKQIERDAPRAKAPATEIVDQWDACGAGIIGDRGFHDYAYYYAVMPGRIRVYEANSPRDLLLTSEREAGLLLRGKRPARWGDKKWSADFDSDRELSTEESQARWQAEAARIERRSAKLYAALPQPLAEKSAAEG